MSRLPGQVPPAPPAAWGEGPPACIELADAELAGLQWAADAPGAPGGQPALLLRLAVAPLALDPARPAFLQEAGYVSGLVLRLEGVTPGRPVTPGEPFDSDLSGPLLGRIRQAELWQGGTRWRALPLDFGAEGALRLVLEMANGSTLQVQARAAVLLGGAQAVLHPSLRC